MNWIMYYNNELIVTKYSSYISQDHRCKDKFMRIGKILPRKSVKSIYDFFKKEINNNSKV